LQIDGLQFVRSASEISGEIEGAGLKRLAEMQCLTPGIRFRLSGGTNERGKPELRLALSGQLQLICQRCLQPLAMALELENRLELAGSQEEIEAAEDEVDRVLAARDMDVAALVEDEVILALPMIPRHENCEAAPEIAAAQAAKKSPFEALAALKRGR
jgi:uncharacterized protein